MQKQKINYLTLQSSYDHIEVALYQNQQKLVTTTISKFVASSELIPKIESNLTQYNLRLNDLQFIGANLGPAPFTTLRTTIVTLNGLNFVTKIPLVGVNGIQTFTQHAKTDCDNLAVIFNAFNKSVYFGIRAKGIVSYGWQTIDLFLKTLISKFNNQSVTIIGQGINSYIYELQSMPENFTIDSNYDQFPNLDLIAQTSLQLYLNNQTCSMLTPLYLKQAEPTK